MAKKENDKIPNLKDFVRYLSQTIYIFEKYIPDNEFEKKDSEIHKIFKSLFSIYMDVDNSNTIAHYHNMIKKSSCLTDKNDSGNSDEFVRKLYKKTLKKFCQPVSQERVFFAAHKNQPVSQERVFFAAHKNQPVSQERVYLPVKNQPVSQERVYLPVKNHPVAEERVFFAHHKGHDKTPLDNSIDNHGDSSLDNNHHTITHNNRNAKQNTNYKPVLLNKRVPIIHNASDNISQHSSVDQLDLSRKIDLQRKTDPRLGDKMNLAHDKGYDVPDSSIPNLLDSGSYDVSASESYDVFDSTTKFNTDTIKIDEKIRKLKHILDKK